jgi:hypothetical protein
MPSIPFRAEVPAFGPSVLLVLEPDIPSTATNLDLGVTLLTVRSPIETKAMAVRANLPLSTWPMIFPPIDLKLSQASPSTDWRREEIYDDEGR